MKDSNVLIAEFMGYESYKYRGYRMFVFEQDNHRTDVDLHYHTSWNWLMPVVEKIEEIPLEEVEGAYKVHRFCVDLKFTQAEITDTSSGLIVGYGDGGNKLDSTYQAVVEFIKWYNKNQKAWKIQTD